MANDSAVYLTAPRGNRDSEIVASKTKLLKEVHVAPITELVREIRAEVGHDYVPYIDPTLGGTNARVLFLLETPARKAAIASGLLSPDNDDSTAENIWMLYRESGLQRDLAVHWNAVPWFIGDAKGNKNARLEDVGAGLPWLERLIALLPRLRLVVAMGEIAQRSFALYLLRPEARLIPWLAVAHPSGRVRNAHPAHWAGTRKAFAKAADACLSEDQ